MSVDFGRLLGALKSGDVEFLIIGGVAAAIHGSARTTLDLDILYRRTHENIARLVHALMPLNPYLRGAPAGLPFQFDIDTVWRGCNFTLTTDAGALDCLGEVTGISNYDAVVARAITSHAHGVECRVIDLDDLIAAKRAAGRPKDFETIAELEVIREERDRAE